MKVVRKEIDAKNGFGGVFVSKGMKRMMKIKTAHRQIITVEGITTVTVMEETVTTVEREETFKISALNLQWD